MKNKRKKRGRWQQALLLLMVILFGLALVFSRGQRAARRVSLPASAPQQEQPKPDQRPVVHDGATDTGYVHSQQEITEDRMLMNITREQLLGFINPATDQDFVLIDEANASRSGMYLRREAYDAFLDMYQAARNDGITLTILSATRNFNHQKRIWENKWYGRQSLEGNISATDIDDPKTRALEIMRFSAMPGTSRHHWGTDIDVNSLHNSYFETGEGKRVYDWLVRNASRFGFCQPYTQHGNQRQGGYEEEKWHWSYIPLASPMLKAYKKHITYDDLMGFAGWETAEMLQVIKNFVLDINSDCVPLE